MKLVKKEEIKKPNNVYNLHIKKNNNYIANDIVVSNCHGAKARIMADILSNTPNACWRFGFTGTLPSLRLESLQCQSYIGPVLEEYGSEQLANEGYISNITIKTLDISYKQKFSGDYRDIRNSVMENNYRNNIICQVCNSTDESILILVREIDEGNTIKEYLENFDKFKNEKEIVFLSGKDNGKIREEWRQRMNKNKNIIMIATYGIFYLGVNIKSLQYVILASPLKSKIFVLQSIGRALRKDDSKVNGSFIIDICDKAKYLISHAKQRQKYYSLENWTIEETKIKEPDCLPIDF